ncbi:hypothetical protein JMM81_20055 [Bacillus sp. V3B]|uniref:hypothetical protein n=1 Tax=Bacillus sp. V3B TaxID=2804915 RepID=UPI00210CCBF2|nr:hypothetical protein [Bacillus sp. V3B]MCQ6277172.1 hypothetical protein [Bacillus sp. V3B]
MNETTEFSFDRVMMDGIQVFGDVPVTQTIKNHEEASMIIHAGFFVVFTPSSHIQGVP